MVACSFCPQPSVSAHLVRQGQIPVKWELGSPADAAKHNDTSHLRVVRVCATHKTQVPR